MSIFKGYHPVVNFIYIIFIMSFSILCTHPLCVGINLVFSVFYLCISKGRYLKFIVPLAVIMALIYPLHNHQGVTVIAYFPDGNPLTLESVVYGFIRAIRVLNRVCWFIVFTTVMTTDKLMYIFGKLSPSVALVFSMILRFVPRFMEQTKRVVRAQRGMGRDIYRGNIFRRAKTVMSVFSIMITWSAENSIEISDSMRARGYGVTKRTAFSTYLFCKRDMYALAVIGFLGLVVFLLLPSVKTGYSYFPSINLFDTKPYFFILYIILCMIPAVIEMCGGIKMSVK